MTASTDREALRPLSDIRVLAVEQYGAGPYGSLLLADLGAEIIKIEDPRVKGDVGRYVPPYQQDEDNLFFEALNRNKASISLDLTTDAGQAVFRQLVEVSDAVYCNLRGDVPDRLGLTHKHLANVNPKIVCCSLSAFGCYSSMRHEPGYDYLLQGLTGWMSVTGEPDGPPTKSGLSLVDFSTGMAAALALLAGVHAARRDNRGTDCDIALYDVALSMLNYLGTWHLTAGYLPERTANSAHPTLVPFQNFQTADGWIVLGCAKEKFWMRLVDALGLPELRDDPRFASFADRKTNADSLLPLLQRAFLQERSQHWLTRLRAARVPCAAILTIPEALAHGMVEERQMIVSYPSPTWGEVRSIASPLKIGSSPVTARRAPKRGEDTERLLTTLLGATPERLHELRAKGAFGCDHTTRATTVQGAQRHS